MKGRATSSTAHLMCGCGHEKLVHGTGLIQYGSMDTACALITCDCPGFLEEPKDRVPRIKKIKPLDREEPKLFEVAQA